MILVDTGPLVAGCPCGSWLTRCFELMEVYADHPMDLADASLVAAGEVLGTRKVFTIDRRDFETYRVRRGYRHYPMELIV